MTKGHGRLNWANRQSPGEFDETAPPARPTYEFDLRRSTEPNTPSWPLKLQGEKFGPRFIGRAWEKGLVVVAEIEGLPHPVAAVETKWAGPGILQVKTTGNWHVPERIWTRKTVRGLSSCGELLREEE